MAGEEEKREGKGFTVQDRRRFSPDTGEARDNVAERPESVESATSPTAGRTESRTASPEETALPEINFSTFIISLSTQALMHLGEIPNPLSGKEERDVPVAKQMIDILGMLNDKTRGNLDNSEAKLMEEILFDLRMKYVEAVKRNRSSE
jgi:hypothetical protein